MTRRVLIVTHGGRPRAVAALAEAIRELKAAGFEYTLHDDALAEESATTWPPTASARACTGPRW